MIDFRRHEVLALDAFRQSGDTDALMVLADHAQEVGDEAYATLLRFLGCPPACATNMGRGGHEPTRFFLSANGRGEAGRDVKGKLRSAACQAFAEGQAMTRELTGKWRYTWRNDGYGLHIPNWFCLLEALVPVRGTIPADGHWRPLNSLSKIDLGSTGRVPGNDAVWDRNTGVPYGPDSYCRVVMAELALASVQLPKELNPYEGLAAAVAAKPKRKRKSR